jgi:MOB kinase activator 1
MDDSSLFPKDAGSTFPSNFMDIIKRIFKRLFRVYAHIYHTHFVEVCNLKVEAHLNTCFKHFIFFAKVRARFAE